MSEEVARTRAVLRSLIHAVLKPLGWSKAGQGLWERDHGEFLQRIQLQPSQWNTSSNYINCILWHRKNGGARRPSRKDFHLSERPEDLDARRASHLKQVLDTAGDQVNRDVWMSGVEKLLTGICLPWLERVDSLDAVADDIRDHHRHLWVAPALIDSVPKRRARKIEAD